MKEQIRRRLLGGRGRWEHNIMKTYLSKLVSPLELSNLLSCSKSASSFLLHLSPFSSSSAKTSSSRMKPWIIVGFLVGHLQPCLSICLYLSVTWHDQPSYPMLSISYNQIIYHRRHTQLIPSLFSVDPFISPTNNIDYLSNTSLLLFCPPPHVCTWTK